MSTSFTIDNSGGEYDDFIPTTDSSMTVTFNSGLGDDVTTNGLDYGTRLDSFTDTNVGVTEHLYSVSDDQPSPTYFTLIVVEDTDGIITQIEVGTTTEVPTNQSGITSFNTYLSTLADYDSLIVGTNDFSSGNNNTDYTYSIDVEEPEAPGGGEGVGGVGDGIVDVGGGGEIIYTDIPNQEITYTGSDITVGGNTVLANNATISVNTNIIDTAPAALYDISYWFSSNSPIYYGGDITDASINSGDVLYYASDISGGITITLNNTDIIFNPGDWQEQQLIIDDLLITITPVFFGSGGFEIHATALESGVPCLTQTCNVLTPNGYQNVSSLKEGDIVTTSDGRNVAIEQLLTSKVNASRITPRVIKAHAYGKNMPIVDTHLSDNHAYQVNGVWKLPKNENLTQQWNEKYVTYYHLKLPNYTQDFLVVNGMNMEGWDGLTPKEFRPYMWVKHGKGVVLKHL